MTAEAVSFQATGLDVDVSLQARSGKRKALLPTTFRWLDRDPIFGWHIIENQDIET